MATSGVRHDSSARLCVLLCESLVLQDPAPPGAQDGLVCHWYSSVSSGSSDHRQSDPFRTAGGGSPVTLDWCCFLVVDNETDADLRLTVATIDGNHLGVYFGSLRELAASDQFDVQELELRNVSGTFAKVTVHAAAQIRWTPSTSPIRAPNSCIFHEAEDDSQAKHIWQFLFNDRPPPKKSDSAALTNNAGQDDRQRRGSTSELMTIEEESSLVGESEPSPDNSYEEDRIRAAHDEEERRRREAEEEVERAAEEAARRRAEEAEEARRRAEEAADRRREEERRRADEDRARAKEEEEEELKSRTAELERERSARRLEEEAEELEAERRRAADKKARRDAEDAEEEANRRHKDEEHDRRLRAEERQKVLEEEDRERAAAQRRREEEDKKAAPPKTRRRSNSKRASVESGENTRQQLQEITNAAARASSAGRRKSSTGAAQAPQAAASRRRPSVKGRRSSKVNVEDIMALQASPRGTSSEPARRTVSTRKDDSSHNRSDSKSKAFSGTRWSSGMAAGYSPKRDDEVFQLDLGHKHDNRPPPAPWEEETREVFHAKPSGARDSFHYTLAGGGELRDTEAQDSDGELRFSPRSDVSDSPPPGSTAARAAALRKMMQTAIGGGPARRHTTSAQQVPAVERTTPNRQAPSEAAYTPMRSRAQTLPAESKEPRRGAAYNSPERRQKGAHNAPGTSSLPSNAQPAGSGRGVPGIDLSPKPKSPAPATAHMADSAAAEAAAKAAEAAAAAAAVIAAPMPGSPRALQVVPMTTGQQALGAAVVPAGRRRIYRVTTAGLGVRVSPDVNAARTGAILRRGDIFEASVVAPGVDGRVYLKIAGARGWVFDDSAVDFNDPSVEPVPEEELIAQQSARSTPGHHWGLQQAEPSAQPPGIAWGEAPLLPFAAATGPGTPGRYNGAPGMRGGPQHQPPALQLLAELGAGQPSSPRSSGLGPPGPAAGGGSPRQRYFGQATGHPSSVGIGHVHLQIGPSLQPASQGPGLALSEEFREAMGGSAYSMARRRPV